MATQMSLMYNAFGCALKDLVALLSVLYTNHKQETVTVSNQKYLANYENDKVEENTNR